MQHAKQISQMISGVHDAQHNSTLRGLREEAFQHMARGIRLFVHGRKKALRSGSGPAPLPAVHW